MSTGVDSFTRPGELGPLYPFPDADWVFVLIALVLWLGWHVLQIRGETRENREAEALYDRIGLDRVMFHGGSGLIATDAEWEEELRRREASGHPEGGLVGGAPRRREDTGGGAGTPPMTGV
jgi:hypothetical protein